MPSGSRRASNGAASTVSGSPATLAGSEETSSRRPDWPGGNSTPRKLSTKLGVPDHRLEVRPVVGRDLKRIPEPLADHSRIRTDSAGSKRLAGRNRFSARDV